MDVKTSASTEPDGIKAAADIHQQIWDENISLAIIYCSSHYDLDRLGQELQSLFGNTPLIGCTTAGEIGPNGFQQDGMVGISITSDGFHASTQVIENLQHFTTEQGSSTFEQLITALKNKTSFSTENAFFLSFIDGLSKKEEHILDVLTNHNLDIPLIGGSAGDNIELKQTHIYHAGKFHTDAAVISLIHTSIPFSIIKENAYEDTGKQLIITEVSEDGRVIKEFNGETAAVAYADAINVNVDELDFAITANHPVAFKFQDELFVRTIIANDADKSLTELPYSCHIEEGMVLRVAKPTNTVSSFEQKINDVQTEIGDISAILGFDCVCRRLIYEQHETLNDMSNTMQKHNVVGFHTYGEQYLHVHVNQTFTGIAFGTLK